MIDLLRNRRSIRKFKPTALENEKIAVLKEALLRSPSSRGINPWEFIFIDNKDTLKTLSSSKMHGSEFLDNSVLGIVVLGDETKSDVWIEDCSIASIIVQLTAHDLGLGSCWVQIRNRNHSEGVTSEQFIQKLLNIPSHMRVLSMIGIGYPDEEKHPVPQERLQAEKIHYNGYGKE